MENLTLDFNNFSSRVGLGTYEKCDSLTLTIVLDEKDYAGYKFKIVSKKIDTLYIKKDILLSANEKLEKVKFLNLNIRKFSTENSRNILDIDSLDSSWIENIADTSEKKLNYESILTDLIKVIKDQSEEIRELKLKLNNQS